MLKADFLTSQNSLAAGWQVLAGSRNNFQTSRDYDNLLNISMTEKCCHVTKSKNRPL